MTKVSSIKRDCLPVFEASDILVDALLVAKRWPTMCNALLFEFLKSSSPRGNKERLARDRVIVGGFLLNTEILKGGSMVLEYKSHLIRINLFIPGIAVHTEVSADGGSGLIASRRACSPRGLHHKIATVLGVMSVIAAKGVFVSTMQSKIVEEKYLTRFDQLSRSRTHT
jgi:hypothetical protein